MSVIRQLLRTKPLAQFLADSEQAEHRPKCTLPAWDLTGLGIGARMDAARRITEFRIRLILLSGEPVRGKTADQLPSLIDLPRWQDLKRSRPLKSEWQEPVLRREGQAPAPSA